jgi:hypothetical protein
MKNGYHYIFHEHSKNNTEKNMYNSMSTHSIVYVKCKDFIKDTIQIHKLKSQSMNTFLIKD